jgi:hypothetical protein
MDCTTQELLMYKDKEVKKQKDKDFNKSYYAANKQKILQRHKERLADPEKLKQHKDSCEKRRLKHFNEMERVKLHYGCQNPSCSWKSEFYGFALDFHHKDRGLKENTLSKMPNKQLTNIAAEINKCVVLCAICHRSVHAGIVSANEWQTCTVAIVDGELIVE